MPRAVLAAVDAAVVRDEGVLGELGMVELGACERQDVHRVRGEALARVR